MSIVRFGGACRPNGRVCVARDFPPIRQSPAAAPNDPCRLRRRRRRAPPCRFLYDNNVLLLLTRIRWSRQWAPDPHPQPSGPCVVRSDRALSVSHVSLSTRTSCFP